MLLASLDTFCQVDVIREEINKTERFLYFVLLLWHNLVGLDGFYNPIKYYSSVKKYYFIQTIGPFIFFFVSPFLYLEVGGNSKTQCIESQHGVV